MKKINTRRGNTQAINQNKSYAEGPLLNLSSAFKKQGGDPEQKLPRMTLFNSPSPVLRTSSPSRERETARGFTLIELLVVVLIIGILSAVALPQYQKTVWKARAVEYLNIINATHKALAAYVLEHGEEEKQFFATGGFGNTNNLSELDLEIPISNKQMPEASIKIDPNYWNISIYPGFMDFSYDMNIPDGICAGWDEKGFVICQYLSTHLPGVSCEDGRAVFPPIPC